MGTVRPCTFVLKTSEECLVRSAGDEDAGQLVRIRDSAEPGDLASAAFNPDWDAEHKLDFIRAFVQMHGRNAGWLYLVAQVDGAVVGSLDFAARREPQKQHTGALSMLVAEEWRDRGIGTALLRTLLGWAREEPSIEKVGLSVVSTNAPAIHLYNKYGFGEEGRLRCANKLEGGQYADDFLMATFVKAPRQGLRRNPDQKQKL